MTLELLPWLVGLAGAQEPATATPQPEAGEVVDPLTPYRLDFDVLTERTIGTASRPVRYNWRRSTVQLAGTGALLAELNNFDSWRLGGLVRVPQRTLLLEVGVHYVSVHDTRASELLALTPYRQPGRPSRLEVDLGVAVPLAEGIVTARTRWFPATQLVFNAHATLRYLVHPSGFRGLTFGQVLGASFSPRLRDDEIANLEGARLDAMAVDPGRYGLMLGFSNDLYFAQGLFVSPRVLLAVPLLAPVSETSLLFWADIGLAVGVAL